MIIDNVIRRIADRAISSAEVASIFARSNATDKSRIVTALDALQSPTGASRNIERLSLRTNSTCGERQRTYIDAFLARYCAKTMQSKQLAALYRPQLADQRTPANFNILLKEAQYPLTLSRACGAELEDIDGNTYVDISGDFGVNLFGHSPSFLVEALKRQIDDGLALAGRYPAMGEAAQLFCEMTGHDRVAFCQSGTEALMSAVRLARAFTDRQKLVLFNHSYHGHADVFLNAFTAGVSEASSSEAIGLPYGAESSLHEIEARAGEVAAVVVEPVQSEGLDLRPVDFLGRLRELTRRKGIVLIFDEMITGLRAHTRGCQGVFEIDSDLATYGKILGGGLTAGAVAGRADIMDWSDGGAWAYGDDSKPGPTTYIAGTHTQNPLKMAATLAVLKELKLRSPQLQIELGRKTEQLALRLDAIFTELRAPVSVSRFASQFRFKFSSRQFSLTQALFLHVLNDRGVKYHMHGNCFLTAAHEPRHLDAIVDAVRRTVEELTEHGFFYEGVGEVEGGDDRHDSQIPRSRGRSGVQAPSPVAAIRPPAAPPLSEAPKGSPPEPPPLVGVEPLPADVARTAEQLKQLIAAFLELGADDFDVDDDLADIGVDSIILVGILKSAAERFGVRVSLKALDGANTVAGIALALCRATLREGGHGGFRESEDPDTTTVAAGKASAVPARDERRRDGKQEAVAIIGMSAVLPDAPDLDAFWNNLCTGRVSLREAPKDRWPVRAHSDLEDATRQATAFWGGYIGNHDGFDPLFFKISPREAKYMDPQERHLLMQTHAALEDAGLDTEALAGSRVGVFVGYEYSDYSDVVREAASRSDDVDPALCGLAERPYYLANRLSFTFDWKGPSEAINVNCASSAVSISRACQSLASGESDLAVAAGVCLHLSPNGYVKAGDLLSASGECRVFDASADGYTRGEGCVALVLKRADEAVRDGDDIYAIVKGCRQTYRGRAASLSEVRHDAVAEAIRGCHAAAAVAPETVRYIEVDGYSTADGDAAEFAGVRSAMGPAGHAGKTCALGSLKGNIGNLEPVSGAASVVKVALSLERGRVPPTVGVQVLNPRIDIDDPGHPLRLAREAIAFGPDDRAAGPVRAGVNSFADSGVNVHILLEERPAPAPTPAPASEAVGPAVFTLSARTASARMGYARRWIRFLEAHPGADVHRLAATLQRGRRAFAFRAAAAVDSATELRAALERLVEEGSGAFWIGDAAAGVTQRPVRTSALDGVVERWVGGQAVDWLALHGGCWPPRLHGLPTYPFELKRYALETAPAFGVSPTASELPGAVETKFAPAPGVNPIDAGAVEPPSHSPAPAGELDAIKAYAGVRAILMAFLEIDEGDVVDESANFAEIGMTSMSIVSFIEEVNRRFGVNLPEIAAFDFPTLEELSTEVLRLRTSASAVQGPPLAESGPNTPAGNLPSIRALEPVFAALG